MKKYIFLLLILQSCIGWGGMFLTKKRIIGNYWIVEGDHGNYSLCYNQGGSDSYIGRTSFDQNVQSYAVKDSFLILKCNDYTGSQFYYVLNMKKDSLYAEPMNVIVDTISKADFETSWLNKAPLEFKIVDKRITK